MGLELCSHQSPSAPRLAGTGLLSQAQRGARHPPSFFDGHSLQSTLWGRDYYYPYFTAGDTEARRGQVTLPRIVTVVDPELEPSALHHLTQCRRPSMNNSWCVWGPAYGVSLVHVLFLSGTITPCGRDLPARCPADEETRRLRKVRDLGQGHKTQRCRAHVQTCLNPTDKRGSLNPARSETSLFDKWQNRDPKGSRGLAKLVVVGSTGAQISRESLTNSSHFTDGPSKAWKEKWQRD